MSNMPYLKAFDHIIQAAVAAKRGDRKGAMAQLTAAVKHPSIKAAIATLEANNQEAFEQAAEEQAAEDQEVSLDLFDDAAQEANADEDEDEESEEEESEDEQEEYTASLTARRRNASVRKLLSK